MTKDQYINKWLNECDPNKRDHMRIMLKTLDINELRRYFLLVDNEKGLSIKQIVNKHNTTGEAARYQIRIGKRLCKIPNENDE